MKLNATLVMALLCLPSAIAAAPVPAGDIGLRHDIQLLSDQDLIAAPVTSWPFSTADLPSSGDGIATPVGERISEATGTSNRFAIGVGGLTGRYTLRSFAAAPRGDGELTLNLTMNQGRFNATVNASRVTGADDRQRWRLDGSQAGFKWGNWWLGASAVDRSWGSELGELTRSVEQCAASPRAGDPPAPG